MRKPLTHLVLLIVALLAGDSLAQSGGELRFCLRSEPKTLNPLLMSDDSSETIRYLTGGVLLRVNRLTQDLEPELATAWKLTNAGKTITFKLRENLRFSDGTTFSADDVAYTIQQLMDPALHSPTGDAFRSGEGKVQTQALANNRIAITFSAPIAGLDKLFDQVAIISAKSPQKEMAVLGPYYVAENKAGAYLILKRNPNYWKRDSTGRPLPYIDSIRLDIQQNRDIEMLRLVRGEIDFINSLDAEYFDKVMPKIPRWRTMPVPPSMRSSCGSIKSPVLPCPRTRRPGSLPPISAVPFRKPSIATTWLASPSADALALL